MKRGKRYNIVKRNVAVGLLLGMLNAGQDASALFPMAREAALTMLEILSKTPPFSYMDIPKHRERIERVFTADNALKYVEFAIKAVTNSLPFEEVPKYADAVMLQRYTAVCGHLAYSLEEYQKAMLDFAEQSDGNEDVPLRVLHQRWTYPSLALASQTQRSI